MSTEFREISKQDPHHSHNFVEAKDQKEIRFSTLPPEVETESFIYCKDFSPSAVPPGLQFQPAASVKKPVC